MPPCQLIRSVACSLQLGWPRTWCMRYALGALLPEVGILRCGADNSRSRASESNFTLTRVQIGSALPLTTAFVLFSPTATRSLSEVLCCSENTRKTVPRAWLPRPPAIQLMRSRVAADWHDQSTPVLSTSLLACHSWRIGNGRRSSAYRGLSDAQSTEEDTDALTAVTECREPPAANSSGCLGGWRCWAARKLLPQIAPPLTRRLLPARR